MAFLFKSKKHQSTALPAATREITSSHSQSPATPGSLNGVVSARDGESNKEAKTPPSGNSVNNSVNSLHDGARSSPEPKTLREKPEPEAQQIVPNVRGVAPLAQAPRPPGESPYPWSQRRLNFATGANPFPRYGAAVNASASLKDGSIYVMGGLTNGSTVKGDLWIVEAGNANMGCYPVATTSEGPGPRVGHASLLVGNAYIVFGGDTKLDEGDTLDDTLYLLNTSTKQWSRALPAGRRPSGRYGHTLNILGSKIYVFGGQVEGFFFNDLVAFDLNALQAASNRWEVLIPSSNDGGPPEGHIPAARTNHTIVMWNEKLYLFGGTDGTRWFNDVWSYDPRTNTWTEQDCIGYIPAPREGHAAALVNDTMYIFGGRTRDGNDLGDLAAFRISSRRWYMFQNMGLSPSPRSGHSMTAYGKFIIVLAGEPSSAPRDAAELSLAYVLDTSKIRYPSNEQAAPPQTAVNLRKNSERSGIPRSGAGHREGSDPPSDVQKRIGPPSRESVMGPPQYAQRPPEMALNGVPGGPGSRLPRASSGPPPSGPPPQQQPPQPRVSGVMQAGFGNRSRTPTRQDRGFGPPVDTARAVETEKATNSPARDDSPAVREAENSLGRMRSESSGGRQTPSQPNSNANANVNANVNAQRKANNEPNRSTKLVSRSASRTEKHTSPVDGIEQAPAKQSLETPRSTSRQQEAIAETPKELPVDSGVGSSPAITHQYDELVRELEAAKSRNAWYASELALARKAGYQPNASSSPILDERAADAFNDDDKPLLEALLKMRAELARVQGSIEAQAVSASNKIAEVEKQRDMAISEAAYAKAKLAAHGGGSQSGTPQLDSGRETGTPDNDRIAETSRRLASSLAAQQDLSSKVDSLTAEIGAERRARQLAEETSEAAQKRVSELDLFKQRNASEVESLKAELHEAQRLARDNGATCAEAVTASKLLSVDKSELTAKLAHAVAEAKNHAAVLESLKAAVTASSDKASLLESKLAQERSSRDGLEQMLTQIRAEHEKSRSDYENMARRLRDAEELAENHAAEARTHREAVLSGLGKALERDDDEEFATDERVLILQQQIEMANALVRRNQQAADTASEKLRRAEERIAGLEAYQEQASREGLSLRRQLQTAMKEVQALQVEKAEMQKEVDREQLESNARLVQLRTLKELLDERGVSATDVRRSRGPDSPGSRFGTPDYQRMRELEQQLENTFKVNEELKANYEQREQEVSREWEEKLAALDNDYQAAVKYLRGTEKMLSKMKQELQRYKNTNTELEKELSHKEKALSKALQLAEQEQSTPPEWQAERDSLHAEIESMQANAKHSISALESQLGSLQAELESARLERDNLHASRAETERRLLDATNQARSDFDALRQENVRLEHRARDAEQKVQLLLDQVESHVDAYRQQAGISERKASVGDHSRISVSEESLYDESVGTVTGAGGGEDDRRVSDGGVSSNGTAEGAALRNSLALDSLANELDTLRSHWETTNKNYGIDDRFDFEKTPTTPGIMDESLASWRRRLELGEDAGDEDDEDDNDGATEVGTGERKDSAPKQDASNTEVEGTAEHNGNGPSSA